MITTHYTLVNAPSGRCYLTLRGSRTIGPLSPQEAKERLETLSK